MKLEINNSWSGSKISGNTTSSFTKRIYNIGNPDVCFIFGGTNDYRDGVPIGEWNYESNEFDTSVFRQSVQKLLYELITLYPKVKFYVVIPTHRNDQGAGRVNGFPVNYNKEKYLSNYQEALIEACNTYGVQYIDTRGLFSYYNVKNYTFEGLHPNTIGMKMLCDFIYSKM